jgi:hypothetical protein
VYCGGLSRRMESSGPVFLEMKGMIRQLPGKQFSKVLL